MTCSRSGIRMAAPFPWINAWLLIFVTIASAALVNFDNCLPASITKSNPLHLQFTPLFLDARFDTSRPSHNLNVTVYGNVSGQQFTGSLPPPDSPKWQDPSETFGKIANVSGNYSTLFADFRVVTFDAYTAAPSQFCESVVNGECPLGPAFGKNASNPSELPAFSVSHNFQSPYYFATFQSTLRVVSGAQGAPALACVSANITPDLGTSIKGLLTWLPAAVLIIKGIATISAAIWSPWGSGDIFRWSSNYGRDEDLLRLVTPGFGDCLQYIQFVTLTGALSLRYPGFYQPAVSQTAWSILMFNYSFVSHGPGTKSLVDGVYMYNGTYGMTAMSQLVGMSETRDIWACMAIFLVVIAAAVIVLTQLGFLGRWIFRIVTHTTEEDLRAKNVPFTVGNLVRLVFNYFILPIVALSLFQLVIADQSPGVVVAMAAITLAIMLITGAWIFRVIFMAKPRTFLFDDMHTVLMYGPLYNTYSDSAAPFALVPVFITFMRGVALGSIQPSGIAQIIVLAICEVVLILTLNGFRPFQGQTSMNAYHTAFAVVRLITVLLAIAFVPSLGVTEASKGWIGYVILLMHALVLIFGFFMNSAQTLLEVVARALGAGGNAQQGAIRGSILNMRMLKKRQNRPTLVQRQSTASNAAMLRHSEGDGRSGMRSRSISVGSNQLLGRSGPLPSLSGFENFSSAGEFPPTSPGTEIGSTGFGYLPVSNFEGKTSISSRHEGEAYYRAPRPRKATLDPFLSGTAAGHAGDLPYQDAPEPGHLRSSTVEAGFASGFFRDRSDSNELGQRPDYAVREVDQYYRGPALSDQPTRKLKTGPADPEGPTANAQSWLQRLFVNMKTNKNKEPTKGFEVVRSARMPIEMQLATEEAVELQSTPPRGHEPYRDSSPVRETKGQRPSGNAVSEKAPARVSSDPMTALHPSAGGHDDGATTMDGLAEHLDGFEEVEQFPNVAPVAPTLDSVIPSGTIDLPSRFNSNRSHRTARSDRDRPPAVPNWLADVDQLTWEHGDRQPRALNDLVPDSDQGRNNLQPFVPRRNSRRISQPMMGSLAEGVVGLEPNSSGAGRSGDVVAATTRSRHGSDAEIRQGTHHRRAADSITRNSLGSNAALHSVAAEVYDASRSAHDETEQS